MSDILLEVDEDLRAQQIKALWDRYGQWIIGLAVVAILGSGVASVWFKHKNATLEQDTAQLVSVLQGESDAKAIATELDKLKGDTSAPLNGVVGLYEAQTLEKLGKLQEARSAYEAITSQLQQPTIIKELAALQSARLGILLKEEPAALLPKIEKLTGDKAPFRASALEMKGLLLSQQGKTAEANKIFEALGSDMNVPGSLRQRAKSLIKNEGVNAK